MATCIERLELPEATRSICEPKIVHCIEPLKDSRWDRFLQQHPRASMFHATPWLLALSQTYGYEPIAYTTSPAGQDLNNGIVFCRVESWLTGRRLVSLPFSDHCEPLVDATEEHDAIAATLQQEIERERWSYLEIRSLAAFEMCASLRMTATTYSFHKLDLSYPIDTIFNSFHKSSTQRKIRRAEREGLTYREGSTPTFLDYFYKLLTLTRKRLGLAPQPKMWFTNLMSCFGDALKIRVAFRCEQPIAAIVTIRYKDTLTYKYGCCDSRFNNLGCMHLLLWNAIQEAKFSGLQFFDFGRTDADQQGLITFKSRWGATPSVLNYSRYSVSDRPTHFLDLYGSKWKSTAAKYVLKHLSPALLPPIGSILYPHIG